MNVEIKVKRVSTRKRSREILRSHLTPAKKRGGGGPCLQQCPPNRRLSSIMADIKAVEVTDLQSYINTSTNSRFIGLPIVR